MVNLPWWLGAPGLDPEPESFSDSTDDSTDDWSSPSRTAPDVALRTGAGFKAENSQSHELVW